MNKKLKMFLFAIGIGAASAPVLASCTYYCVVEYKACIKAGEPVDQCVAERDACEDSCGG
ncbi:MAG: hypothetical protein V4476_01570 [Pseudomonadota bacterium]